MQKSKLHLFPILSITAIILVIFYLSQRFTFFFNIQKPELLYLTFSIIIVFMFAGITFFINSTNHILSILYITAYITAGIILYMTLSAIIVDLTEIFTNFRPICYGITIIVLTIIISAYGIWNSWNIRTTNLNIEIKGLTKNVRAVHLSDIHIGHFRGKKFMQKIADKTKAANPDVVFITGDLFDSRIRLNNEAIEPLKQIKVPIYFVAGNHDRYTNVREIKHELTAIGVHVLSNEKTMFKDIQIIGLNHIIADENTTNRHAESGGPTIKSVLKSLPIDKNKPSILLHHSPDGIKYANKAGIDLYLTGHTHGGQMFPVNFISGWMFDYNHGLHDYKGTKIFVSEGVGTFGPPMRVGTKSEIVVLNLTSTNNI